MVICTWKNNKMCENCIDKYGKMVCVCDGDCDYKKETIESVCKHCKKVFNMIVDYRDCETRYDLFEMIDDVYNYLISIDETEGL